MKNIHVLPTEKPSRLAKSTKSGLNAAKKGKGLYESGRFGITTFNIYITSDEEIKEGDWTLMFDDLGNLFLCDKPQQYLGIEKGHHLNKGLRKIILTTDQDLIKDGVQAIDDEFLQWFVKNQSCEWVEVIKQELNTDYRSDWKQKFYYKLIISKEEELSKDEIDRFFVDMVCNPKEEPKQKKMEFYTKEQLQIAYNCGLSDGKFNNIDYSITDNFAPIEEPKQETFEEALKNELEFVHNSCRNFDFDLGFKTGGLIGAKWQQERSYNEEEVLNKLTHFAVEIQRQNKKGVFPLRIKEWFERNKNK